jgi:hypothetical protein
MYPADNEHLQTRGLKLAVETSHWVSTELRCGGIPGRMSTIDKQRIAAVRKLEAMGYVFRDEWIAPAGVTMPATTEADAMHVLLVLRADQIEGCTEGSPEEAEFNAKADAVDPHRGRESQPDNNCEELRGTARRG